MKPAAGTLYALRGSHITHLPPALVLTEDEWFWAHDPYGRPVAFWPVAEAGIPPLRHVYDQLGVPVARMRITPDPHIGVALPCVEALRGLTLPVLSGPGNVPALKAFQEALPAGLALEVVPPQRLEHLWEDYEPRARRAWRTDPNRPNSERFMRDGARAASRRIAAG